MTARKKRPSLTKAPQEKARRAQVDLGAKAKVLVENELLRAALDGLSKVYFDDFRAAQDPESAWRSKQMCDAHQRFSRHLVTLVVAGENALSLLRHEEELHKGQPEAYDFQAYQQRATAARREWAEMNGTGTP